jgi:hypothetical protein
VIKNYKKAQAWDRYKIKVEKNLKVDKALKKTKMGEFKFRDKGVFRPKEN